MKKLKKFLIGTMLIYIAAFPIVISSCYYDYGLDTDNYDVVATFYDKDYNFQNVHTYYLSDSVVKIGDQSITSQYDNQIIQNLETNLNNLGWTRTYDRLAADVNVRSGVTTSTYVVYDGGSGCYWDYWGYSWCYPDYGYSYTYTTGTIAILMTDPDVTTGGSLPAQWNALLNGLTGTGNAGSRITTAINKAFAQSPYLR
ncbi:MAG: hypothetical protein HGGPFJEG_02205 [Ignavibacteria bacterium]|nr:hypothetical protein [Ignavibacteria bacterium]